MSEAPPAASHEASAATATVNEALQATSVEEQGRKVFVGNLSFATKEEELKEVFTAHGPLTEAQIILRGTRSLGYGFVTFSSAEDAQKAVGALDKTEIGGRVVNVEMAKPPPGAPGGGAPRAAAKAARAGGHAGEGGAGEEGTATVPKKKRSSKKKKRTPATAAEGDASLPANGDVNGAPQLAPEVLAADATGAPAIPVEGGVKKARRGKKTKKTRAAGVAGESGAEGASGEASADKRVKKRGPPTGELSKTMLFIANLPFALTDEGLKTAFETYNVVSAHVVKRRFGPAEGRSKGFGFVELATEQDQKNALEAMQGKEVEGRALQIKVAVNEAKNAETGEEQAAVPTATEAA